MRIADFITQHMEVILQQWEDFARTIKTPGSPMSATGLRDHAVLMLQDVAADLRNRQSDHEQAEKSKGRGPVRGYETAAEAHGGERLLSGFTIKQLVSEYRALRASVLYLWAAESRNGLLTDPDDVTRFNEAIDQLLAESIDQYSAMVEKSQNMFLAILGHDLRNPLGTTITAASYIMAAQDLEPKYTVAARRIYNSGKRMNKLVEDLIDFTRSHLGTGLPLSPKPANLGTVCQVAVEELRTLHQERKIEFTTDVALEGTWDEGRMVQVFSNLIGNALKHGSQTEPVKVHVFAIEDDVLATVWNAGPPIPIDKMQSIFSPLVGFATEDAANHTAGKSLGIGLHIAREIILAHKGTITVRSTDEAGTTFTLRMPKSPDYGHTTRV